MSSKRKRAEDEDFQFLEQVLDKFYDFDNGAGTKKKLKLQKKKKRKEGDEEAEEEFTADNVCSDADDSRVTVASGVQTAPAAQQPNHVAVVTFQDPRKKLKTRQTPAAPTLSAPQVTEKKKSDQLEELTLEKARLEVHRFGITGYKKEQQRVFEQDRAIMLGARPPKKDYVNYKMLQQQIMDKKQKAKEEVQPDLKKKKKKPSKPRDKKKTSDSGSGSTLGQMGRFKNGMLVLSSKDIDKIKGRKRRK